MAERDGGARRARARAARRALIVGKPFDLDELERVLGEATAWVDDRETRVRENGNGGWCILAYGER